MMQPHVNAESFSPQLLVSDNMDWTSAPIAPVPMNAVAKEAIEDAEDIGAIEHEHEVGPKLREVAGLAAVEAKHVEHF